MRVGGSEGGSKDRSLCEKLTSHNFSWNWISYSNSSKKYIRNPKTHIIYCGNCLNYTGINNDCF